MVMPTMGGGRKSFFSRSNWSLPDVRHLNTINFNRYAHANGQKCTFFASVCSKHETFVNAVQINFAARTKCTCFGKNEVYKKYVGSILVGQQFSKKFGIRKIRIFSHLIDKP